MRWVEERPIVKLCRSAEMRRRTTPRLYWWEQPMDLDEASAGAPTDATTEGDRGDRERAPYPLDVKTLNARSAARTGNFHGQIVLGLRTFRLTYP